MKNKKHFFTLISVILLSSSSLLGQAKQDSTKANPKYEYAFIYLTRDVINKTFSDYVPGLIIDFENGKQEDFGKANSLVINSQLNTNSDTLFKAFKYLTSMRYELVTSLGDFRYEVQYTFRREIK